MSLSSTSLPRPKNWEDFERSTRALFACVLNDPNTQQNGRQGQPQKGVDVYGYRRADCLVGIQCKKKLRNKISAEELRTEVNKAKGFKPPLAEFILVTTAPRDQAVQETARQITLELASTANPMHVSTWGWDDIEEHVSKYQDAWKAFDPTWDPFVEAGFEKVALQLAQIQQSVDQQNQQRVQTSPGVADVFTDATSENTPLHGKISAYVALIDDGHMQAALAQLTKTKDADWVSASRSERYRLLVAIASAKLRLGEPEAAGTHLLDGYAECPEHKNARKNRAKGYLLKGDFRKAVEVAAEILKSDAADADVAGTLIQARAHDTASVSPLEGVPKPLHETEEVLIAYIHFLRCKNNREWTTLASQFLGKHPDSKLLKLFAAEAVLDELIQSDRDATAGGLPRIVAPHKIPKAAQLLKDEARDALNKNYALVASTVHNAALALRIVDDSASAKELLDAALQRCPKDKSLQLQRALVAYSESDVNMVLELFSEAPSDPEAIPLVAHALIEAGRVDDALNSIDRIDLSKVPEYVKFGLLAARCHAYLARGERELAVETAERESLKDPANVHPRAVLIRTYRLVGRHEEAFEALDDALRFVDGTTPFSSRLLLSFEAQRLDRNDVIVNLLKGRVATDYENEALFALVAAAINGQFWATARETLDAVSSEVSQSEVFQRARTVLAINTGEPAADAKIAAYLARWPNNALIISAQIAALQRAGRKVDLAKYLRELTLENLEGTPDMRIRIAAQVVHCGEAERGLKFAYSVLMDNWNVPRAHLAYHGLMLFSDDKMMVMPSSNAVGENTVVCLKDEDGERRYRLEEQRHFFFEEERLSIDSDLARILLGRKVGEKFALHDRIGSKQVEMLWIKPVYIDAFHRSLEQFNERFPRASGLQRFTFDINAPDPFDEIREVTKARAEADQHIIDQYRKTAIPLSFAAALIGKDPLDAWSGLPSVNVPFHVCRGNHEEREQTLTLIRDRERTGCMLDAITLSVIRRLGVEEAVAAVCGPIRTTQSVLDLLAVRALEAKHEIGKKKGFISWHQDQLVLTEYSEEMLRQAADECETERSWAVSKLTVVPAMPKHDFSEEMRTMMELVGHAVCDPAIAAHGNDLLLLSDDMGYRSWSTAAFNVPTAWLQPVLMVARAENHLSVEKYYEAVITLVLSGYSYISLETDCLNYEGRKNDFGVNDRLGRLIDAVGGPLADLRTNCNVIARFLDSAVEECPDETAAMRIASRVFKSMTRERAENRRDIVGLIIKRLKARPRWMREHVLGWLVGHSIGMPDFDEMLTKYKDLFGPKPSEI